jgi:hypothetical protein
LSRVSGDATRSWTCRRRPNGSGSCSDDERGLQLPTVHPRRRCTTSVVSPSANTRKPASTSTSRSRCAVLPPLIVTAGRRRSSSSARTSALVVAGRVARAAGLGAGAAPLGGHGKLAPTLRCPVQDRPDQAEAAPLTRQAADQLDSAAGPGRRSARSSWSAGWACGARPRTAGGHRGRPGCPKRRMRRTEGRHSRTS